MPWMKVNCSPLKLCVLIVKWETPFIVSNDGYYGGYEVGSPTIVIGDKSPSFTWKLGVNGRKGSRSNQDSADPWHRLSPSPWAKSLSSRLSWRWIVIGSKYDSLLWFLGHSNRVLALDWPEVYFIATRVHFHLQCPTYKYFTIFVKMVSNKPKQ